MIRFHNYPARHSRTFVSILGSCTGRHGSELIVLFALGVRVFKSARTRQVDPSERSMTALAIRLLHLAHKLVPSLLRPVCPSVRPVHCSHSPVADSFLTSSRGKQI